MLVLPFVTSVVMLTVTSKDLLKEKRSLKMMQRRGEDQIQKLTDKFIAEVDQMLEQKEKDLMEI